MAAMKVGIISDTHGQIDRLHRAIDLLTAQGADTLVHCGDLGGDDCLRALGHSGKPAYAVCGNVDRQLPHLMDLAAEVGVEMHWEVIEVPLGDGRYLVATHGHDAQLVSELLAGRQFPYVCHGHSHQRRDERVGGVHVINPGALHRAKSLSVALLDTAKDKVEFLAV